MRRALAEARSWAIPASLLQWILSRCLQRPDLYDKILGSAEIPLKAIQQDLDCIQSLIFAVLRDT